MKARETRVGAVTTQNGKLPEWGLAQSAGRPKVSVTDLGLGASFLVALLWSQGEGRRKQVSMRRCVEKVIRRVDALCPLPQEELSTRPQSQE